MPDQGLSYNIGDMLDGADEAAVAAFLAAVDAILARISEIIGYDLTPFLEAAVVVIANLETIFGSLNPLSGEFDPAEALQAATNLLFALGISLPAGLLGSAGSTELGLFIRRLLTVDSALNPAKLQSNLWPDGIFPTAECLDGGDYWTFDPDVTRTVDATGSVHISADG